MLKKKTLIILLLSLHLSFCLKQNDFCSIKQKEYKCQGIFIHKCGTDLCAKNKTDCFEYIQKNLNSKQLLGKQAKINNLKEKNKMALFKKNIKQCDYKFRVDDFCLSVKHCTETKISPTSLGYKKIFFKVICKCPSKQSYRCGKYCTTDSTACNYYKSNVKDRKYNNIKKCVDLKISTAKSFFSIF